MLEESLRQLIAFACDKKMLIRPENIESMTLGNLFSWLKKNLMEDYKIYGDKNITKAIKIRNYITHWIHAQTFPNSKNQLIIKKIFIACILFFEDMDSHTSVIIQDKYEPNYFHMRSLFVSKVDLT